MYFLTASNSDDYNCTRSRAILNKIITYQTHKHKQLCKHWRELGVPDIGVNCFCERIRFLKAWGEFQISGWAIADRWLFICRLLHLANIFSAVHSVLSFYRGSPTLCHIFSFFISLQDCFLIHPWHYCSLSQQIKIPTEAQTQAEKDRGPKWIIS